MSQSKKTPEERSAAMKLRLAGIFAGVVLAIVCHYVPAQYQTACHAVSKIAAVSCGG